MSRPERSRQERRIARGREADAAFERIYAEALARVVGGFRLCPCCQGPMEDHAETCKRGRD